jgi:3-hydroxyisobutyrate dehydrogenase
VGAKEARLSIMVGGDEEAVSAVKPLFDVMGKNIVHLGPASSGASDSVPVYKTTGQMSLL